jgi:hypothetical protein
MSREPWDAGRSSRRGGAVRRTPGGSASLAVACGRVGMQPPVARRRIYDFLSRR